MKLNLKALCLSTGIIWALCFFLLTLVSVPTGYGKEFLKAIGSIYPGYSITWAGSLLGLIYAFVDGFLGGLIFGLIYNALVREKKA